MSARGCTYIRCHSEQAGSAMALFPGVFLERLDVDDVATHPAEWEKVVRMRSRGSATARVRSKPTNR